MSRFSAITKRLLREQQVSQYVPLTHVCSPHVVQTQAGQLLSVIELHGHSFDLQSNQVLNQLQRSWHQALLQCCDDVTLMVRLQRQPMHLSLTDSFDNKAATEIDAHYRRSFDDTPLFENRWYLYVIHNGFSPRPKRGIKEWLKMACWQAVVPEHRRCRLAAMQSLDHVVKQFMFSLKDYRPKLLSATDQTSEGPSILSNVSHVLNGGTNSVVFDSDYYPLIANKEMPQCVRDQHVGQYCCHHRISFGQAIQFGEGSAPIRFAAMLSIKQYPHASASVMLDRLLRMPFEYTSSHWFIPIGHSKADTRIKRQANRLKQVDDAAVSQQYQLDVLRDRHSSGVVRMGLHQNSVMVLADGNEQLDDNVRNMIDAYQKAGFVAVREGIGQQAAYWSQVPGNQQLLNRLSLISSMNFTDFCSLHNYPCATYVQNHLSKPVMLTKTLANTPVWFHCHAKGPADNPASGHTMAIGGNGCGKTVLLCFLDAQLSRFKGHHYCFDRDRGMEIYWRASGGEYLVLSPDSLSSLHLNPFQLNDSPQTRAFCLQWMQSLVLTQVESAVPAKVTEQIRQCVDYAFDVLEKPYRTLRNAIALLPMDFSHWPQLRRWVSGQSPHGDGEYAYLFDHDNDHLKLSSRMGFDFSYFMDQSHSDALMPIVLYLMYRIQSSLQGQLVTVIIDEAWQLLRQAGWQDVLSQWLPTLRKKNAHVIMATQSPHTVATSPIRHCILDNCATQLYFANPQAKCSEYCDAMGLSDTEWQAVRDNDPSARVLLYKQGKQSQLLNFDLSALGAWLSVMSASTSSLALMDDIVEKHGAEPALWLPVFMRACS